MAHTSTRTATQLAKHSAKLARLSELSWMPPPRPAKVELNSGVPAQVGRRPRVAQAALVVADV
eukprot:2440354-Alexandrium_andersonii.AAC.1